MTKKIANFFQEKSTRPDKILATPMCLAQHATVFPCTRMVDTVMLQAEKLPSITARREAISQKDCSMPIINTCTETLKPTQIMYH